MTFREEVSQILQKTVRNWQSAYNDLAIVGGIIDKLPKLIFFLLQRTEQLEDQIGQLEEKVKELEAKSVTRLTSKK